MASSNKDGGLVRRLISQSRTRADEPSSHNNSSSDDNLGSSPTTSSTSWKRRNQSVNHKQNHAMSGLQRIGRAKTTASGPARGGRSKPLQISSPRLPNAETDGLRFGRIAADTGSPSERGDISSSRRRPSARSHYYRDAGRGPAAPQSDAKDHHYHPPTKAIPAHTRTTLKDQRAAPPRPMREQPVKPAPPPLGLMDHISHDAMPPDIVPSSSSQRRQQLGQQSSNQKRQTRRSVTRAQTTLQHKPSLNSTRKARRSRAWSVASSDRSSFAVIDQSALDSFAAWEKQGNREHPALEGLNNDLKEFILEAEKAFQLQESSGSSDSGSLSRTPSTTTNTRSTRRRSGIKPVHVSRAGSRPLSSHRRSQSLHRYQNSLSSSRSGLTPKPLKTRTTGLEASPSLKSPSIDKPLPPMPMKDNMRRHGPSSFRKQAAPPRERGTSSNISKWGLSEGMTDILTGQRFKKIEADEMLTPERLAKLQQMKQKMQEAEEESDRSGSEGSNTSNEAPRSNSSWKSHRTGQSMTTNMTENWMDLETDSGDDGYRSHHNEPIASPWTTEGEVLGRLSPKPEAQRKRDTAWSSQTGGEIPIIFEGTLEDDSVFPLNLRKKPINNKDTAALPPLPPPKSTRRSVHVAHQIKRERKKTPAREDSNDTIKTQTIVAPKPPPSPPVDCPSPSSSCYSDASFDPGPATPASAVCPSMVPAHRLFAREDEDNFYLRSTPYTLTAPGFQHGAIRFVKSEMGPGAIKMDDTLDWTAFQMAILGGSNDIGDIVEECEDTRVAEDLTGWYDELGFDKVGGLVDRDAVRTPSTASTAVHRPNSIKSVSSMPKMTIKRKPVSMMGSRTTSTTTSPAPASPAASPPTIALSSSASSSSDSLSSVSSENAAPQPLSVRRKRPALPTLTTTHLPGRKSGPVVALGPASPARAPAPAPTKISEQPSKKAGRPLVVGGNGPDGVDEEVADAPMGFNLNDDLGDFLRWEAEYAYATDL